MKQIIPFLFTLLTATFLYAQTQDDNIIIDYKTESFTYKAYSKQVYLVEKTTANYRSLKWADKITVVEFYNLYSTINAVDIKAEKTITPTYEMYKDDGVFYSDRKVCYFELPFSKKDVKASVSFTKTHKDICIFHEIIFPEPQFVKEKKVEINVPLWMEVEILEQNFSNNIEKEIVTNVELQLVTYRYTIREQEGVKIVDDAPAYHKIVPHLLLIPKKATLKQESILYFDHYDDVYKWCNDKIAQTQNDLGVVSKFTQQLIDTCKTDDEKISLIFAWVQYNIRYIAFEYGLDSWIPDNAQNVLRKKYGDCKGMSNLLRIML